MSRVDFRMNYFKMVFGISDGAHVPCSITKCNTAECENLLSPYFMSMSACSMEYRMLKYIDIKVGYNVIAGEHGALAPP